MSSRRVTSYDVAARAGVSQSAVSRAFAEDGSASRKMRERVARAADELGYRPDAIARSLGRGRSGLVGMVVNKHSGQAHANALAGITELLRGTGGGVLLQVVDADGLADGAVAALLDYRVDAILCSSTLSAEAARQCARAEVALCLVNREAPGPRVDEVLSDNAACSAEVALGLAAAGARRTAYLQGPAPGFVGGLRFAGFAAGCERAGLAPPVRVHCEFTHRGGHDATLALVREHPGIDAIVAATDAMAIGAVDALRERCGLRVPKDVRVVGHDDEAAAGYAGYRLTTVRAPMEAMLDTALGLARRRAARPGAPRRRVVMASEIVQRGTATWTLEVGERRPASPSSGSAPGAFTGTDRTGGRPGAKDDR